MLRFSCTRSLERVTNELDQGFTTLLRLFEGILLLFDDAQVVSVHSIVPICYQPLSCRSAKDSFRCIQCN